VAGYTRQSSADIIATAVVRANPLNVEYNAIRDAFSASTGHKHDGTAAEGAYVPLIADSDALNKVAIDTSNNRVGVFVEVSSAAVEQIRIQDGAIVPVTTNDIDLGTSSLQFKDLYLDGTATIDVLQVDTNSTLTGNLTVNGNTTLGDAASDTVTVTADVASPLIPSADDTYDLGAVGSEWRNLYVDGTANIDALVADTADINGGTIDGATIGGASAAAGTFTSLNASGTSTLATVDINAGAIDGAIIGANSAAAITGTTITGTSLVGPVTGDVTGNADTATALETARTIGGVSFNGTANINLPGVNTSGNQDTSGNAATATALETARTIGGVSFDGTANISLPGVNTTGNQDTSGNAASATVLETARSIAGQSFDGSASITIAATDLSDTDQSLATSDNVQFAQVTTTGNAIIGGNLTVNGTTTTVNSSNMTVDDQLIELGNGRSGSASGDAGIVIERGSDANAFIGFDESADKFTVGTGTFTGASTGDLTITTGTLVANIEGNVTGAVTGNADTATALETARTIAGQSFDGTANISIAPTDLTGVNATAAEINIVDGDTSATATTLADADRVVVNDAGIMKQVALTDFETYFETSLDTLNNVTTVGALNSGSITSGFGAIDNGSSAITTTGTITFGSITDGVITATAFVDEDNMSSNSATLIPTQQSVKAYVDSVAGTSNNVTGLTATGAELNAVADFSAVSVDTSTAIANSDALLVFDNGNNIGYRDVDLLDTYFSGTTKTLTNKTITSPIVTGMHLNDSGFSVEGSSADGNDTTVAFTNPTANRTITFPDATGNVAVFTTAPAAAIADGSSGQFLTTNGSGVLSFADAGGGASTEIPILAKTASYTVVAGDAGKIVSFSGGAYTATLTAAATLGSGFFCFIENNAATSQATHTVTIDPNGSETIDGRTTFIVRQGERVQLVCDGSNFKLISSFHRGIATNMRTDFFDPPKALGGESVAIGLGTIAGVGNTTNAIAIGTNAQAGSNATAIGGSTNAGSSYSTALGKNSGGGGSVTATGSGAMALGGSYASGVDSFAAAIDNNTSSYGANGAQSIAMGVLTKSNSSYGTAIGYQCGNYASYGLAMGRSTSNYAEDGIAIGDSVSNLGANSVAIGDRAYTSATGSFALGTQSRTFQQYQFTYAGGQFAALGDAQGSMYILRKATTDTTASVLTTDGAAAGASNQIEVQTDQCLTFDGTITAMQNGAQAFASFKIEGLLVNDGGTTTLANSAITIIDNQSSWGMALSADNTNNALAITVTGEASHNIRWVANIRTSEVTYA
jgi:hypothetical protein